MTKMYKKATARNKLLKDFGLSHADFKKMQSWQDTPLGTARLPSSTRISCNPN